MCTPNGSVPDRDENLIEKGRRLRAEAKRLCAETRQQIEHLQWLVDSVRRQWRPDYFQPLQDAIRIMHGCESRHTASFSVRKVENGEVLWSGTVEEFELDGMVGADACYAWTYVENGQAQTFSLLKQPPASSPHAAVQLFLLSKKGLPATAVMA